MPNQNIEFANAQPTGAPELSYPLPLHSPTHVQITQRMVVKSIHYQGPPLDEVHPLYPKAYCVRDENHTLSGPIQQFDRIYMTVPASGVAIESATVTFPAIGATTTAGSYHVTESGGAVRQHYADIIPRATELSLSVPVHRHRHYFIPGLVGGIGSIEDAPQQLAFSPTDSNGIPIADLETAGATPSAADYARYVENQYHIVVEPTILTNYAGNIWLAQTTTARAR